MPRLYAAGDNAVSKMGDGKVGPTLDVCEEARDRMKAFASLHHQYTLHYERTVRQHTSQIRFTSALTGDGVGQLEVSSSPRF